MISLEELEKLRIANSIIERGNRRLGLRPIYANFGLKQKTNTTQLRTNKLKRLSLNQVASQLQEEKKLKQKTKSSNTGKIFFNMSAVVGIFALWSVSRD